MVLSAIALIIQFLPGILGSAGVVSPKMSELIAKLGGVVPGLITSLASGGGISADTIDLLDAFKQEITTLQTNTKLDPVTLSLVASLIAAIDAAVLAYQSAQTIDDPSTLTQLPTNL